MAINRVAVQTIIDTVPAKLRNAARAERQALIKETKKDPIAASFMAAKGEIPFFNNNKLQTELGKLNNKLAAEAYEAKTAGEFIQRQPHGSMIAESAERPVVHASMNLG